MENVRSEREFSFREGLISLVIRNGFKNPFIKEAWSDKALETRFFDTKHVVGKESLITSFAVNDCFVAVGIMSKSIQSNTIENRQKVSEILILKKDFSVHRRYALNCGVPIKMKYDSNCLFILLSNGQILKYIDNKVEETKEYLLKLKKNNVVIKEENNREKWKSINPVEFKVTLFDVKDGIMAYTDGYRLFFNDHTRIYNSLITNIMIYKKTLVIVDVNGRICIANEDLKEIREITSKRILTVTKLVGSQLILFQGFNHATIDLDKLEKTGKIKEVSNPNFLFVQEERKKVIYHTKIKDKKTDMVLLRIVKGNGFYYLYKTEIIGKKPSLEKKKQEELIECLPVKIVDVVENNKVVIFCTECGMVIGTMFRKRGSKLQV